MKRYDDIDKEINQKINEGLIIPTPRTLSNLCGLRLESRKLEAVAPSTGYASVDACLRALVPGRLALLTGDTNLGKTTFCCNLAYRVAKQGRRVLYLALETGEVVYDLFVSIAQKKRLDQLTDDDLQSFQNQALPIETLTGEDFKNFETIKAVIRSQKDCALVIIDHVGYLDSVGQVVEEFTPQQSRTVRELALLAKETKTHIMLVAHLNKTFSPTSTRWIPSMKQISGSAAFGQDTQDILILARRPLEGEFYSVEYDDSAVIFVAKTKSPKGKPIAKLHILPNTAYWYDDFDVRNGSTLEVDEETEEQHDSFVETVKTVLF